MVISYAFISFFLYHIPLLCCRTKKPVQMDYTFRNSAERYYYTVVIWCSYDNKHTGVIVHCHLKVVWMQSEKQLCINGYCGGGWVSAVRVNEISADMMLLPKLWEKDSKMDIVMKVSGSFLSSADKERYSQF